MDLSTLKCICGQIYNEDQFSKHFRECIKFKDEFKEFDSKFGELLKTYSEPIERLIIVRYLLKQYIQVIERKITSRFKNNKNPQKINPPMQPPPLPQHRFLLKTIIPTIFQIIRILIKEILIHS